jgi:predicted Zn finger-like uncharacterized protein
VVKAQRLDINLQFAPIMMQLITRCPQCKTAFAFDAAKLRLAQGWVRCGRCETLFEAAQHLYEREGESIAAQMALAAEQPGSHSAERSTSNGIKGQDAQNNQLEDQQEDHSKEEPIDLLRSDLRALHEALEDASVPPQTSSIAPYARSLAHPGQAAEVGQEYSPQASDKLRDVLLSVDSKSSKEQATHPALWVRVVSTLCLFLLVFSALAQVLWTYKETIGALSAESHLLTQALCESLGVELGWPRQLKHLKIESSQFKPYSEGHYSVGLTLKNTQDLVALQTPWIELTLSGAEDTVLVRKIFKPNELELQAAIAPGKELNVDFAIALDPGLAAQVVGYQLNVFYP